MEAESESHVNRLSREISALRLAQQQTVNGNGNVTGNGSGSLSPIEPRIHPVPLNPIEPTTEMMLEAMRRENEQLRGRLIETERDYIRIARLNDIYREELIEHRRRVSGHPNIVFVLYFSSLVTACVCGILLMPREAWFARRQPYWTGSI